MGNKATLERLNAVLGEPFGSLEACLAHYREALPRRVGSYHQEEVGPIYHHEGLGDADRFVEKEFHLGEGTVDMSEGLDWYATATGDLEWNGGLVRHGYFMLLAEEYRKTGNEVYAQTIVEHILDHIENVLPFEPEGKPYLDYKKSTWRPFEVSVRDTSRQGQTLETRHLKRRPVISEAPFPRSVAKCEAFAALTPLPRTKICFPALFASASSWATCPISRKGQALQRRLVCRYIFVHPFLLLHVSSSN